MVLLSLTPNAMINMKTKIYVIVFDLIRSSLNVKFVVHTIVKMYSIRVTSYRVAHLCDFIDSVDRERSLAHIYGVSACICLGYLLLFGLTRSQPDKK